MMISSQSFLQSSPWAFEIDPRLDQIDLALAWLKQIADEARWPQRTVFGLTLSLDEALTNIVNYAIKPNVAPTSAIRLTCVCDAKGIVLQIEDEGVAFDPTLATPPARAETLEDAEIGGHGLRLMHHYLNAIHYERRNGHNVLTLVGR